MSHPKFESLENRALMASSISGTVFNDANSNGLRDAGEVGLANQRVFIDENSDGIFQDTETSQFTDADGEYSFGGLEAGTYHVCVTTPNKFRQTAPQSRIFSITTSGNEVHAANDFGLTRTGVVKGFIFNDTNSDGVRQSNEPGIAGIRVYVDKNGNGLFDAGQEISRITNLDGAYRFAGLKAGKYTLRIAKPGGVELSSPDVIKIKLKSGQSLASRNWGLI